MKKEGIGLPMGWVMILFKDSAAVLTQLHNNKKQMKNQNSRADD